MATSDTTGPTFVYRAIASSRFLSPLKILATDHKAVRRNLLVYPALCAVAMTTLLWWIGVDFPVFGEEGAIGRAGAIGGLLLGFAITALAAAAAFPSGGMIDEPMPSRHRVRIPIRIRDHYEWTEATRRQFLCHLLAWMCFLCLGAFVADYATTLLAHGVRDLVTSESARVAFHWVGAFLAFWFIANFVFLLLIVIYYFADRLNQPSLRWDPPSQRNKSN